MEIARPSSGKDYDDLRTSMTLRCHLDDTSVGLHNSLGDRHPEPGASGLRRIERVEDPRPLLRVKSRAVVADRDLERGRGIDLFHPGNALLNDGAVSFRYHWRFEFFMGDIFANRETTFRTVIGSSASDAAYDYENDDF